MPRKRIDAFFGRVVCGREHVSCMAVLCHQIYMSIARVHAVVCFERACQEGVHSYIFDQYAC